MGRILAHTDLQGRIQRFLNDTAGDRLATRVAGSQGGSDTDWQRSGEHEGTRYRFNRAGNLDTWPSRFFDQYQIDVSALARARRGPAK